jgi:quinoprotein glucose dehydrogenase
MRLILFCLFAALSASAAEPALAPIFTGKDLSGWKKPKLAECWIVKDGVLTVKNNAKRQGETLWTQKDYENFICELEFKFDSGTIDSGVMLRNSDQIQVGISGSLKRDMTASPYIPGKGYPVEAKGVKDLLKMRDWNSLRIRAIGGDYTTWLNGKEVMNYSSSSAKDKGPIGIQLHGGRTMTIHYRNVRVAELSQAPKTKVPKKKAAVPAGGEGFAISASGAEGGNPARNAFDSDPNTRWSANGKQQWIQVNFDKPATLSEVFLGFHHGDRRYNVVLASSMDGKDWKLLDKRRSAGKGPALEKFWFEKTTMRHLRYTNNGSNKNDWSNLHTFSIPGFTPKLTAAAVAPVKSETGKLVAELWAENPLVISPVGLAFDHQGRAYATRVRRRKVASLDLRQHRNWVKHDLAIQSVADKLTFYQSAVTDQKREGVPTWAPKDRNGDGKKDFTDLSVLKDEIRVISDTDGDGKPDKSEILDSYGTPTTGIAAGALVHNGDLYVACEPDIWRYEGGDPKKRTRISTGYSIHIGQGGHNMSGLAVGFDGRIYWSVGDKGINATGPDGSKVFLPNRGGVMRCEPDGSNLECFSPGVRNGQELAFDQYGNLFTVDNDGDYPGERERFLYLMEGGEIGWRLNWQWYAYQDFAKVSGEKPYNPWMAEQLFKTRFDGQAAYILPPVANYSNGPCGFAYNPGTALNARYKDHFFIAQGKSLFAFQVEPDGAKFRMKGDHQVLKGPWNTGVTFGPDGALYIADWMGGPSERGRIYKVDDPAAAANSARAETHKLLRDGFAKRDTSELRKLLAHADMRVRRESQFELVRRKDVEGLTAALKQTGHQLARLHGIWGLGQLGRKDANIMDPLATHLSDPDPHVRRQLLRIFGESELYPVALLKMLTEDPDITVRAEAAIAMSRLDGPVDRLVAAAVTNADKDAYLRHAIVMGLTFQKAADLAKLATHESASARLVAILALRRQLAPEIADFLQDSDPYLVTETALAIHDDLSIPGALPALAAALERRDVPGEPFLRRAINANFRVGTPDCATRLANFAARDDVPENMRTTALACLALWAKPPVLDAVEGRYRTYAPRDPAVAAAALSSVADTLAKSGSDKILIVCARAIERLQSKELLPLVHAMYLSDKASGKLRMQLLATMSSLADPDIAKYVEMAIKAKLSGVAQKYADVLGLSGIDVAKRALTKGDLAEKRAAIATLAESAEGKTILKAALANSAAEIQLDLQLALGISDDHSATLAGGDAERGKSVAQGHAAAQCIRCHKIRGAGGELGPDLSTIASRLNPDQLLASLLAPSAELAEGFGMLIATLKDGSSITGTITKTTAKTYELLTPEGKPLTIARANIASEQMASAMPPMGAILTKHEIRDLMAYLQELK